MAKQKKPHRPPGPKKPPLTHFLCLPLVTQASKPQLESSVAAFRTDVTTQHPPRESPEVSADDADEAVMPTVHPKAIRPVGALHCTLGVMSLKQEQLETAIELLRGLDVQKLLHEASSPPSSGSETRANDSTAESNLSPQFNSTDPSTARSSTSLTIDLKGLESMHAAQKTSILYIAPSDSSDRLHAFCVTLQKVFKDSGMLVEDSRPLKLHATIVNTIYAKGRKRSPKKTQGNMTSAVQQGASSSTTEPRATGDRSSGHGPNANAPLKIDATHIIEQYRNYTWAENVALDRVAICEMGAKKIFDEQGNVKAEEYTEVASVALPT